MARVALARRDLLLRAHRHRLRTEDLEDCYSQATLELIQRARSGTPFANPAHIANALEQKLLSRINDRRRALAGRSPIEAALGQAVTLEPPEGGTGQLADPGPGVDEQVAIRSELRILREIASELTPDMRLVLAHQVGLGTECQTFCRLYRWSPEKFRKVAQRARRRLFALTEEYESGERCRRLEPDLLAYVSRVAGDVQRDRVESHLDNCAPCRRRARDLLVAERGLLGFVPGVLEAGPGSVASTTIGSASGGTGAAVGGGVAAWGAPGALGLKVGVAAICVASLAGGGLALCRRGPLADVFVGHDAAPRRVVRTVPRPRPRLLAQRPSAVVAPARPSAIVAVPNASVVSSRGLTRGSSSTPAAGAATVAAAARREFGFAPLAGTGTAPVGPAPRRSARILLERKPAARRRRVGRRERHGMTPDGTTRLVSPAPPLAPQQPTATAPGPPPSAAATSTAGSRPGSSNGTDSEFGFERG